MFQGKKRNLLHLALNTSNITEWAEKEGKEAREAAREYVEKIDSLVEFQREKGIPILTVKLLHLAPGLEKELCKYFARLAEDERIRKAKVRIFIIGNWYDLDSELVQSMKKLMEKTKDYDQNFLNFCIAYDGQEEILQAVRVIARQVKNGKVVLDQIDEETVKQNMASSYFPPPDLIIENSRVYSGLLLWDSKNSFIHFTNKFWMETTKKDYEKAIEEFEKHT